MRNHVTDIQNEVNFVVIERSTESGLRSRTEQDTMSTATGSQEKRSSKCRKPRVRGETQVHVVHSLEVSVESVCQREQDSYSYSYSYETVQQSG